MNSETCFLLPASRIPAGWRLTVAAVCVWLPPLTHSSQAAERITEPTLPALRAVASVSSSVQVSVPGDIVSGGNGQSGIGRALITSREDIKARGLILSQWLPNAGMAPDATQRLVQQLHEQGVTEGRIMGVDSAGIPMVCGYEGPSSSIAPLRRVKDSSEARGWECVPGVIRDDGVDSFRLEVNTAVAVAGVSLHIYGIELDVPAGTTLTLRDDGLNGDRVPGDFVFTSEPLRYNTNLPLAPNLDYETNSPAGLGRIGFVGNVEILELNGQTNGFLATPSVGVLSTGLALTRTVALSSNVVCAPHLINVRTTGRHTQKQLRSLSSDMSEVTRPLYRVLPDAFDFLLLFSVDHVEAQPKTASVNYNAGIHLPVQMNFSGTGQDQFTYSPSYGSSNRLLSLNIMDTGGRGICSQNATHELIHQWSAFTSTSLGLSDGTGHYNPRCSVGSLVGGVLWTTNLSGEFTLNCDEGRAGAHWAALLDKYMMGLIDASAVPALHVYPETDPPPYFVCGTNITVIERTVTMAQIQGLHGVRVPGPAQAQRDFAIGFVAESCGRFLTPVEMTFHEILAAHYTKPIPPAQPAPYLSTPGWVPVERFFGEGTTWSSDVLAWVIRPELTGIRCAPGEPVTILGQGYPGVDYTLLSSTNLVSWDRLATNTAPQSRALEFTDPGSTNFTRRFYKLRTL